VISLRYIRLRQKSSHSPFPAPAVARHRGRIAVVLAHLTAVLALLLVVGACGQKPKPAQEPEQHHKLTGLVIQLDPKLHTATIDNEPIAGWMEAMRMDYPIRTAQDFEKLHVGDHITATVNVRGTDYDLSDIQKQNSSK
jgi:Cu/Ag efflux protein CusF